MDTHISGKLAPETAIIGPEERAAYERDGFAVVRGLVPPAELPKLREVYDGLFETRAGWEKGDLFDMIDTAEANGPMTLPQLAWPSRHAPWLAGTQMTRRGHALAAEILGPRAELVWEFAIRKPPRIGAPTPWHQDEASFTVGTPYRVALSCWVALQDVDEVTGCMIYVPGSRHGPLLPHRTVGADPRTHGLVAIDPDLSRAVSVPLRAGDAVIHHSRTLHGAGANRSNEPRRALTLEFAVRDRAELVREDFAWNRKKFTYRDERERRATPLAQRLRRQVRQTLIRLGW
jgi:hypothetical protein